jgi:hypothetical protein
MSARDVLMRVPLLVARRGGQGKRADATLSALTAAGLVVVDRVVLQVALAVLCAAHKSNDWHPNFQRDFDTAIEGLRDALHAPPAAQEPGQ